MNPSVKPRELSRGRLGRGEVQRFRSPRPRPGFNDSGSTCSKRRRTFTDFRMIIYPVSEEIFALLDRVICLCHQRAIYHGPATELSRWLERSGRTVPRDYNPADYVMFLMETLPKRELESFVDKSRISCDSSFRPSADGAPVPQRLDPSKMRKSFGLQVRIL
eukprot:s4828_g3.t1